MRAVMNVGRRCASAVALRDKASAWAELQARKAQCAVILETVPTCETVLPGLRAKTTKQRAAMAKAADIKKLFWQQKFDSLEQLVAFYEEMMFPVHKLRDDIYNTWVDKCGINSKIVQTVTPTAENMNAWKAEFGSLGDQIQAWEEEKAAYAVKAFDVDVFNYILNVLRLAIDEGVSGAHQTAIRVFHDMTDLGIAFNDATQLLLKNICFGDGLQDNSDLLFSLIEYPERGTHTFDPKESIEEISTRVLDLISERHTVELDQSYQLQRDDAKLLRPRSSLTKDELEQLEHENVEKVAASA